MDLFGKKISGFISFQFHPNLSGFIRKKYFRICKIHICPNLSRFFWIFLEKIYPDLFGKNINFIHLFHPNLSRFFWIYLEKKYPDLLVSNFIQIYLDFFGFIWKKYFRICKFHPIYPNLSRFFWIYLEKKYPDLLVSNFIQIYLDFFGFIWIKYFRICKIQICPNLSRFFWIYLDKIQICKIQICPNLSRFFLIFLEKKYPDLLVSNFIQIYLDFFGFIWKKNIRIY